MKEDIYSQFFPIAAAWLSPENVYINFKSWEFANVFGREKIKLLLLFLCKKKFTWRGKKQETENDENFLHHFIIFYISSRTQTWVSELKLRNFAILRIRTIRSIINFNVNNVVNPGKKEVNDALNMSKTDTKCQK